jgi:hypothetical protein
MGMTLYRFVGESDKCSHYEFYGTLNYAIFQAFSCLVVNYTDRKKAFSMICFSFACACMINVYMTRLVDYEVATDKEHLAALIEDTRIIYHLQRTCYIL